MERANAISGLKRQVRFEVIPKQKTERACFYIADFVYFENGKLIVEDTKSKATMTPEYIIKRKLMKLNYPDYEFREIVKVR